MTGLALAMGSALAAAPAEGEVPFPAEHRYLGRTVPDVAFEAAGGPTTLSAWSGPGPLLLAFAPTRCGGVCSPYLLSLAGAERIVGATGVRTLVLSIDPRDTVADMNGMAERLGLADEAAWALGVAAPADVAALTEAVGFSFRWDEARGQYDHPGMVAGIRDGRVARLLVGPEVDPARLDEVIRELRGERVESWRLPGRVLFRCFEYDPDTGRFTLGWGLAVLAVPALCALAATLVAFRSGERARRAGAADRATDAPPPTSPQRDIVGPP